MKYCRNCGTPMDDSALFCPSCGSEQNGSSQRYYGERPIWQAADDNMPHPWIATFSFIIPILGLIFFSIWRYSSPSKARAAAKGGFYGVSFSYPIVGLILFLVFKESRYDTAKGCGVSAIIGVCFKAVIIIVMLVYSYTTGTTIDLLDFTETAAFIH